MYHYNVDFSAMGENPAWTWDALLHSTALECLIHSSQSRGLELGDTERASHYISFHKEQTYNWGIEFFKTAQYKIVFNKLVKTSPFIIPVRGKYHDLSMSLADFSCAMLFLSLYPPTLFFNEKPWSKPPSSTLIYGSVNRMLEYR